MIKRPTIRFKSTLIANIRNKKDYYFGEVIKIGKPWYAIIITDMVNQKT